MTRAKGYSPNLDSETRKELEKLRAEIYDEIKGICQYGDVSQLQTDLDTAEGDIDNLQTAVTAAEGDIDDLETTVGSHTSSLSSLDSRLNTAEGEIDTLQSTVSGHTSDISGLDSRLDTAESDIDDLQDHAARTDTIPVFAGGVGGVEGGEIHLKEPGEGNTYKDCVIDRVGNSIRIFAENNPNYNGCHIDFSEQATGAGSKILTETAGRAVNVKFTPRAISTWSNTSAIGDFFGGQLPAGDDPYYFVLPPGGTWLFDAWKVWEWFAFSSGTGYGIESMFFPDPTAFIDHACGILAGGSTIGYGSDDTIWFGWCWRIA